MKTGATDGLPQVLRNNANWLAERGTFPKAAEACRKAADEIERMRDALKEAEWLILNGRELGFVPVAPSEPALAKITAALKETR